MEETAKVPGQHKIHFRTLILSDLHLGTKDAQARELLDVLRGIRCDKLILNGDIIDLWSLQRKNHWSPAHTAVIRRIMKMAEKDGTKVVYLRGNHDDFIRRLIPLVLDRIELAEEHIHVAQDGRKYLCIHGDAFDTVTVKMRWLAVIGDISYQLLLDLNRFYNRWRAWRGWTPRAGSSAASVPARPSCCTAASTRPRPRRVVSSTPIPPIWWPSRCKACGATTISCPPSRPIR